MYEQADDCEDFGIASQHREQEKENLGGSRYPKLNRNGPDEACYLRCATTEPGSTFKRNKCLFVRNPQQEYSIIPAIPAR